jgi:outer membrane receptor protein involved in Fe transport
VLPTICAGFLVFASTARAHENEPHGHAPAASATPPPPEEPPPQQIEVKAEKGTSAASADEVRQRDLALRPRVRPGDILEVVPGLFAVQHAGGGKANQYFLRGFDADHGTDIALFVDGVPINMVSHGHGQGYSDLNFVIPELVSTLSSQKGPYSAKYGDFATAGAIDLQYYNHLHKSAVTGQVGNFGIRRALFMVAPELGDDWSTIVAGEAYADNGPFANPEKLRRFNLFGRATRNMGFGGLTLTWMSYSGGWNASGQVPLRAVGTPELPDEFGSIDPTEGGSTQRHQASIAYVYRHDDDEARALLYFVKSAFTLYSNFTFFADDPVNGDGREFDDDRTMIGASWSYKRTRKIGDASFATTIGMQARHDSIDNGLFHQASRKIIGTLVDAGITETSVGLYAEEDARLLPFLRVVAGLRFDRFDVNVKDRAESQDPASPASSGIAGSTRVSPKASMILSPAHFIDLFLNFGRGFHSNDARGAVLRAPGHTVTLLAPATGYEAGTRLKLFEKIDLAAAVFRLDMDSEIVWLGDEGTTEARGPTRRIGVELEGRWKLLPWLFLDADATFTKATFTENAGNGNGVALAPTRTFAGGVGVKHPSGVFGSVRVRSIASRPANDGEDRLRNPLDAEGWTLFDAELGYRWKDIEFAVDVRNLGNASWKEVQFANTSRTRTEVQKGIPAQHDIHFTPGWPFTALGRVTYYL